MEKSYNFVIQIPPYSSYLKELFESSKDADLVFVSKENEKFFAHKLIMGLFCPLIKDLFIGPSGETSISYIHLPDFSSKAIHAFIELFYCGIFYIGNDEHQQEFISLCENFQCDKIPILENLKKPEIVPSVKQSENSNVQQIFGNEHVETIFFNEHNDTFSDQKHDKIKEEYLNEEYLHENQSFEIQEESISQIEEDLTECQTKETDGDESPQSKTSARKKLMKPTSKKSISVAPPVINLNQLRQEQEKFKKRLQEAINSCRDEGISPKKAAKLFGVPVNSIERNLKGYKRLQSFQS